MKNEYIFLAFLLVFCTSIIFPQKRINWGEDPINLNYNGSRGMITIKYLDNPKCITLGASGKKTTGMGGKGIIIDIDSLNFFSGNIISSGIVYACANPTEFPDNLNRSRIIIVKKTIVNTVVQFVQCDSLQSIAIALGLLSEKVSKGFSQLNQRINEVENRSKAKNKNQSFDPFYFWNLVWEIPLAVLVGLGIAEVVEWLFPHHEDIAPITTDGVGPGGHTGPVFKMFKIVLGI